MGRWGFVGRRFWVGTRAIGGRVRPVRRASYQLLETRLSREVLQIADRHRQPKHHYQHLEEWFFGAVVGGTGGRQVWRTFHRGQDVLLTLWWALDVENHWMVMILTKVIRTMMMMTMSCHVVDDTPRFLLPWRSFWSKT